MKKTISNFLYIVVTVLLFAGIYYISQSHYYYIDSQNEILSYTQIILYGLLWSVIYSIAIGLIKLIIALISKYKIITFRILCFEFYRLNDKIKFKLSFNKYSLTELKGYKNEKAYHPYLLTSPILSLCLTVLCLVLLFTLSKGEYDYYDFNVNGFFISSLIIGAFHLILTAVPSFSNNPNDFALFIELFDERYNQAYNVVLNANLMIANGKKFEELDVNKIDDPQNLYEFKQVFLAITKDIANECNDINYLEKIYSFNFKSKAKLAIDFEYILVLAKNDLNKAKNYYENMPVQYRNYITKTNDPFFARYNFFIKKIFLNQLSEYDEKYLLSKISNSIYEEVVNYNIKELNSNIKVN